MVRNAEFVKLFRTSGTLIGIHSPRKTPTYYNEVPYEKFDRSTGIAKKRARGTAGGDRITVPYCVSTPTASMVLNKVHLNAVVSENARFGTIDIVDYYLGTDMPDPEYLKLYLEGYPPSLLVDLDLTQYAKYGSTDRPYMYAAIVKTMPGLPQSGWLSQTRLIDHLGSGGYRQTSTPMLFRHEERDIDFTLVVDDFGVKYKLDAD